jgi:hypothetical protein
MTTIYDDIVTERRTGGESSPEPAKKSYEYGEHRSEIHTGLLSLLWLEQSM